MIAVGVFVDDIYFVCGGCGMRHDYCGSVVFRVDIQRQLFRGERAIVLGKEIILVTIVGQIRV